MMAFFFLRKKNTHTYNQSYISFLTTRSTYSDIVSGLDKKVLIVEGGTGALLHDLWLTDEIRTAAIKEDHSVVDRRRYRCGCWRGSGRGVVDDEVSRRIEIWRALTQSCESPRGTGLTIESAAHCNERERIEQLTIAAFC
jgi:hypothetical protein